MEGGPIFTAGRRVGIIRCGRGHPAVSPALDGPPALKPRKSMTPAIDKIQENEPAYKMISRMAAYIVILGWTLLGLYILTVAQNEGPRVDILKYFLSTEQSGIKFRALMLLGPFLLTVIAYLIKKRSSDLSRVNRILIRENTARRESEEELSRRAFYDALTSLPNRALFLDHLNIALERTKRYPDHVFAVFFLDVDRFKVINDGLGHFGGDQLLIAISRRLKKNTRAIDTVARFGGDEFAILMEEAGDISAVTDLSDRIMGEMAAPFHVSGHEIFASVSIGIVLSDLGDYNGPDELIRDADIAMYHAKARGKACHVIFDSTMQAQAAATLWFETELRRAVEKNEFTVYYQPIISMKNNKIIGFEALVRWQHPTRGLIPPMEFMTAAEETGLILPIGQWVIREACRQLLEWQQRFPEYGDVTVSVNVSSKVFAQPEFYDVIEQILRETGLDAGKLRLEIVERMLIENPEPAAHLLKRLQDLNVRFDIDDFGTGYSALNYLRQFPINGLKIDRSFIKAIAFSKNSAEIVKIIIALAHALNMDVIAEGIETTEQLEIFRTMKGEYAQGFFIFRPMDSKSVEDLLSPK
jgi:diguanylate cyclase (GGDEF)-like protein